MAVRTVPRRKGAQDAGTLLPGWPGADLAELNWAQTPCRLDPEPDKWFPVTRVKGPNKADIAERAVAEARALCEACRLKAACLELAVRETDPTGVRGGLAEHELIAFVKDELRHRATTEMVVAA
jgi:hypothetical protein